VPDLVRKLNKKYRVSTCADYYVDIYNLPICWEPSYVVGCLKSNTKDYSSLIPTRLSFLKTYIVPHDPGRSIARGLPRKVWQRDAVLHHHDGVYNGGFSNPQRNVSDDL
jgi:hypothetical protein